MTTSHLPYLNSNLEPPSVQQLAEAMAEETWLDALVLDVGMLERVKVVTLHISRESESVTFSQDFKPDLDEPKIEQLQMEIGCDDIIYVKPTKLESVDQVPRAEPPPKEAKPEDFEAMKDAAIQAVAEITGGTALALMKVLMNGGYTKPQDMIDRRHLLLWALFEMSDMAPPSLCWELGWKSPMPFQSARSKFTGKHANDKWPPTIKKVVLRAREIGNVGWRRPDENSWRTECILP